MTEPAADSPARGGTGLGGRRPGRILLGAIVISCLTQLVALYRPEGPATPAGIPYADKAGHLLIFALPVLLIMLWRAARLGGPPSSLFGAIVCAVFAGHAVLSEVVQGAVLPQRSGDPYDVVADLLGIVVGYGTAVLIITRRSRGDR